MSFHSWIEFLNSSARRTRRVSFKRPAARRFNLESLEGRTVLSISPGVAYPVGSSPQAVATGDFNGDGRPDLALAISGALTGSVDVLLGNADGTFQTAQNSAAAFGIRSLAAGDLDADGTVDLVTANSGTVFAAGSMSLLFGNGDGTFQSPVNSPFGDNPISVAMGDLDGDGDLDIVETTKVYSYTEPVFKVRVYDYYVAVFLNDLDPINHYANLNFAYSYYLNSGDFSRLPDSIRIADINGHPSVVFTSLESNIVRVMLGNSTGALQSPISFSTGTSPRSVAVGDINGDGIVDLVTANSGSNDVSVLLGNGSGTPLFQSAISYAAGTSPVSVALAEINGDGHLDIVVANSGSNNVSVLLGNGNGTFQMALSYAAGSSPSSVAAGNFNGDSSPAGRPYNDLAVANLTGNAVSVLLNAADWVLPTTVVGRHVFYNQSAWDGNSAAINFVSDELARAPDKTAYLPGDPTAAAFNITNFSRGINGIMVDLAGSGTHQSISASDFVFKVGNDNSPASWAAAPSPASIAVSLGGGVDGSDRVEITWATGAIANKWLEVQVLATANTGLTSPDVFFWGNKVGDSASGTLDANNFITNTTDASQVFATLTGPGAAAITDVRDYNRDKTINTTDAAIVFAQLGNLNRLQVGGGGPFAPRGGGGGGSSPGDNDSSGDAGIASALAATASNPTTAALFTVPIESATRPRHVELDQSRSTTFVGPIAGQDPWATPKREIAVDEIFEALGQDDELLDSLLAGHRWGIRRRA